MLDNKNYTKQVEGKPRMLIAEIQAKDVTGSTHHKTIEIYFDKEKATEKKVLKDMKAEIKEKLEEKDFTERFGNLLSTDKIVSVTTTQTDLLKEK